MGVFDSVNQRDGTKSAASMACIDQIICPTQTDGGSILNVQIMQSQNGWHDG